MAPVDARLEWLRQRSCQLLDVPPALFEPLLQDPASASLLKDFVNGGKAFSGAASALLVYSYPSPLDASEAALAKTLGQQSSGVASDLIAPGPQADEASASPRIAASMGDAEPNPSAESSQAPKVAGRSSLVLSKLRKYADTPLALYVTHSSLPKDRGACPAAYFARGAGSSGLTKEALEEVSHGLLAQGAPSLQLLDQVLGRVYIPLLQAQAARNASGGKLLQAEEAPRTGGVLGTLHKFEGHVRSIMHQSQGDVVLDIPDLDFSDPEAVVNDEAAMGQVESVLAAWLAAITELMQREGAKKATGTGPMEEIAFWRARNAAVGGMFEQLCNPAAQALISFADVHVGDVHLVHSFKSAFSNLQRWTEGARDNLKFLATLERHFEVLETGTLIAVADAMAPLMAALRMVWIISRHYGDDERMKALFSRIACKLADRVEAAVQTQALFAAPEADAKKLLEEARTVCLKWFSSYMEMRETIEAGGRDSRWEFSKAMLFEKSSHAASVCSDLAACVTQTATFRKFLSPRLRIVTGNPRMMDEVLALVDELVACITQCGFRIFDPLQNPLWETTREEFNSMDANVQDATMNLINTSFKKLRNADAALQLLASFHGTEDSGPLAAQLLAKTTEILAQYARELDSASGQFRAGKADPPLAKGAPPVAGGIQWARGLLAKVQRTMHTLQSHHASLLEASFGQMVTSQYRGLARQVMMYEQSKFESWKASIDASVIAMLRQTPLTTNAAGRIVVNLPPALRVASEEAWLLDRQGFGVPPAAQNLALQRKHYTGLADSLQAMLTGYHQAVDQLTDVEKTVLAERRATLLSTLDQGFGPLTWTSLCIPEFISTVQQATNDFQALVIQLRKASKAVMDTMQSIATTRLCAGLKSQPDGQPLADIPSLKEISDDLEILSSQVVDEVLEKHASLTPLLRTVEEMVCGTATGRAPACAKFFAHWEAGLHQALHDMILQGIKDLVSLLAPKSAPVGAIPAFAPLFQNRLAGQMKLQLVAMEVAPDPSLVEVEKAFSAMARTLMEHAKRFPRWMDGTCLSAPPLPGATDEEEPFLHSFLPAISESPAIVTAVLAMTQHLSTTLAIVNRYVASWSRLQAMWKLDKSAVIAKFQTQSPGTAAQEGRLAQFARQLEVFDGTTDQFDAGFICIDASFLTANARCEAATWLVRTCGAMVGDSDCAAMQAAQEWCDAVLADLPSKDPKVQEGARQRLHQQAAAMHLQVADLAERSRLRTHFMALAAPILEGSAQLSGRAQTSLAQLWAAGAQDTTVDQDQAMSQKLHSSWGQLLAASYAEPVQRLSKGAESGSKLELTSEEAATLVPDEGQVGGWDEAEEEEPEEGDGDGDDAED